MNINEIRSEIRDHPSNSPQLKLGYEPIFSAAPESKIVIIGQAPGRVAQESGIPWNDVSGDTLRDWLGLSREQFYDEKLIALVPMDFYFPGKGKSGDLPPRKEFAEMWHPQILSSMTDLQLTILVGRYAQSYYLGDTAKRNLTETVRAASEYLPTQLPLVHPSPLTIRWRKQNPWFESETLPEARSIVSNILPD